LAFVLVVLAYLRNVRRERVNRSPVINNDNQQRQLILRSAIQNLRHPPVLTTTLPDEHDAEAVLVVGIHAGNLVEILVIPQSHHLILQNTLRRPRRIR